MIEKPQRISNGEVLASFRSRPCVVCGSIPSDAAHVRSVGSGGDDSEENLISLCRYDHAMQHQIGWPAFWCRNPSVEIYLSKKGWSLQGKKLTFNR